MGEWFNQSTTTPLTSPILQGGNNSLLFYFRPRSGVHRLPRRRHSAAHRATVVRALLLHVAALGARQRGKARLWRHFCRRDVIIVTITLHEKKIVNFEKCLRVVESIEIYEIRFFFRFIFEIWTCNKSCDRVYSLGKNLITRLCRTEFLFDS